MYLSDLKHPEASLEDKLHRLYTLNREKDIDLGFRPPFLELLSALGNPQNHLPPVIHVAGTNGKGSIIAILKSILEEAGYSVHAYTSPHLIKFNERITLDGRHIDDHFLEELIDEALEINKKAKATFFEVTTAIAFAAFARTPADITLLEVGLGGRLDCTNIIPSALVSVINIIARDHMEHLGDTLPLIAGEKSGIMKKGVPCVIGVQTPEALEAGVMEVFESQAIKAGSKLICTGSDWVIEPQGETMSFSYTGQSQVLPYPGLKGAYQINNAGAALTALKVIQGQFPVSHEARASGLQKAHWPGRLQNISKGFQELLPDGWEIWLDGGHNENAAQALAVQCKNWRKTSSKPLHLIMGMLNHKDPLTYLEPLEPYLSSLTLIDIPGEPKSFKGQDIIKPLEEHFLKLSVSYEPSFEEALSAFVQNKNAPARILIGGSLYLAGYVLEKYSKSCAN